MKTTTAEIYEWGRRAASFPLAGKGSEGVTPYPFALTARDRTTAYVRQAPAASDQKDCRHVGIDGLGDREARAKAERSAGFLGRTLKGSTGRCDALKQGEIKQVDGAKLVAGMEEQLLIAG